MRIVRSPQEMALAEERDERHRDVVVLERRVDLPLEELARLRDEGAAALVGPELLGLPEPPVAIVDLFAHPSNQPPNASPCTPLFSAPALCRRRPAPTGVLGAHTQSGCGCVKGSHSPPRNCGVRCRTYRCTH